MKMDLDNCSSCNNGLGDTSSNVEGYLGTMYKGETLYLEFQNGVAMFSPEPNDLWQLTTNDECNPPLLVTTFMFNMTTNTFLTVRLVGFDNTAAAQVFTVEFTGIDNTYRIRTTGFSYLQLAQFGDDLVLSTTDNVFDATPFMVMPMTIS